ncbi:hypothetical protein T08_7243 [Trichinella sp. T8]|nr:hypothetical protein T08_7243 [Trichinella sp. T8]
MKFTTPNNSFYLINHYNRQIIPPVQSAAVSKSDKNEYLAKAKFSHANALTLLQTPTQHSTFQKIFIK